MSSIDVVVPCYRYGRYLRQCVESVLSQDVADLRVLIIDDQSPDESPDVGQALAEQDGRITFRRHAVNQGHISTYNEGIAWARADYMLLLSADDYLLPSALHRAMHLLDTSPKMAFCFGNALVMSEEDLPSWHGAIANTKEHAAAELNCSEFVRLFVEAGSRNIVNTPTVVVRTMILKQLGGYRMDLPHSGDLELWLRLAANGSIGFVNAKQAVYRRHSGNMSLAYYDDNCLSDMGQRKAAFEAFRETCRSRLPDGQRLYRNLAKALARDAVGFSSSAFNRNQLDLSAQLRDFALGLDPSVRLTFAWSAVTVKLAIGSTMTSALLTAVGRARAFLAWLRGHDAKGAPGRFGSR